MSSKENQHPLFYLQLIEDERDFVMGKTKMDQIKFLHREFKFLDIFLRWLSFTPEFNMAKITQKVRLMFQDVAVDLTWIHEFYFFQRNVDTKISQVKNKFLMTKTEIRANYNSFPKISTNMEDIGDPRRVLEFIDTVMESLGDLLRISDPSSPLFVPGPKKLIEEVLKELKLLRHFVCFVSDRCIEPQSQRTFFTHVLGVAGHVATVAWLYLPSQVNRDQEDSGGEMDALLSDLMRMRIKPIQPCVRNIYGDVLQALKSVQSRWYPIVRIEYVAECEAGFVDTLLHNLNDATNPIPVALKDQMETLREMLNLLRANLIPLQTQNLILHIQNIDTVIADAGLVIYQDVPNLEQVNRPPLVDFPSYIERIKSVIYLIIRKEFQSNLPRIHGTGYVDFLLNNLNEFLGRYSDSLDLVKNQLLQTVQKELENVQSFLNGKRQDKRSVPQDSSSSLIGYAYEVEYIVDACTSNEVPNWCLISWLNDIIAEIRAEVAKVQAEKRISDGDIVSPSDTASDQMETWLQLARTPEMNEEIVGFVDEKKYLMKKLKFGDKELDVISIVGMPGRGKTTLAYSLYSDKSVVSHFRIRAECCVSQVYRRLDLLLAILRGVMSEAPTFNKPPTADEVAEELRKALRHKKYLILIDDVWDVSAWKDLQFCFENCNKGSRIILTTRNDSVAAFASGEDGDPLHLREFKEDESRDLLEKKVFGGKRCPPHLVQVETEIAKKCGNLPLSIVLVAGILAKMDKEEKCWKQVAAELGPHIHSDSKAIIETSYQHLPYHLKLCFLYFGAFREDEGVSVSKLTWLWISEGFITSHEGDHKCEDTAEHYLENLIGRNLVMSAKKSCIGKIKTCRVHDILHEYCKEKAKEENLLLWITRDQNAKPSSCIYSHKQLAQRRMSIYSSEDNFLEWSSSCSLAGSVLYRDVRDLSTISNTSYLFSNFRFLKVLDMEFTLVDSFPTNLVHLRYFAAKMDTEAITSSIVNLGNLETLIIRAMERSLRRSLELPCTILKMVKLRHFHIYDTAYLTSIVAKELDETSTVLHGLETFFSLKCDLAEDMKLMLKKTPNLRKLKCSLLLCHSPLSIFNHLTRLETLNFRSVSASFRISDESFPSNLKKLTVVGANLWSQDVSNIAVLRNLQVLKLKNVIFYDGVWNVGEKEFLGLKVLKLYKIGWHTWYVSRKAFPKLERLVLHQCGLLKEIPDCFNDITSLKCIEVKDCEDSVVDSAEKIMETQVEDNENSDFKLVIHKIRRV